MVQNPYSEMIIKGLLNAFQAAKDKQKSDDEPKRALVRFSLNLMKNFLGSISESHCTEFGTDPEKITKWPSIETRTEKSSDYKSAAMSPRDVNMLSYRDFKAPSVGVKRKRKGKFTR